MYVCVEALEYLTGLTKAKNTLSPSQTEPSLQSQSGSLYPSSSVVRLWAGVIQILKIALRTTHESPSAVSGRTRMHACMHRISMLPTLLASPTDQMIYVRLVIPINDRST